MSVASEMQRIADSLDAVSAGKVSIADAITAKGVPTAMDATFEQLAVNVGLIEGGETPETITIVGNYTNGATISEYLNSIIPDLGYTRGIIIKKPPLSSSTYIAAIIPFQGGAVMGTPHRYRNSTGLGATAYTSGSAYSLYDGAEYVIFHW